VGHVHKANDDLRPHKAVMNVTVTARKWMVARPRPIPTFQHAASKRAKNFTPQSKLTIA
jgi:hypothetical protein